MGDLPPAAFGLGFACFNYGLFVGIPVSFSVFLCIFRSVVSLVVSTSVIDCLERPASWMIYCVSSGTLNSAHLHQTTAAKTRT